MTAVTAPISVEPDASAAHDWVGWALLALILLGWIAYPMLRRGNPLDGAPIIAAGSLFGTQPDAVYDPGARSVADVSPAMHARQCELIAGTPECDYETVAFVSTPAALPVAAAFARLDDDQAVLALREAAALAAVAGVLVLGVRFGRMADAEMPLLLTCVALTPVVLLSIDLAQTSTLLLVLVGAPMFSLAGRRRGAEVVVGLGLAVLGALKGFPLLVAPVAALARRWYAVGTAIVAFAALVLIAAIVAPIELWREFADASQGLASGTRLAPYNGAITSGLDQLGLGGGVAIAVWVGVAATIAWAFVRAAGHEQRWVLAWVGALLLFPQVWAHYSVIGVAAVAVLVARRTDLTRSLWALPAAAALTVPPAVIRAASARPGAILLVCNLCLFALVLVLVRTERRPAMA